MDLDRQPLERVNTTLASSKIGRQLQRHRIPLLGVAFVVFVALAFRFGPGLWPRYSGGARPGRATGTQPVGAGQN